MAKTAALIDLCSAVSIEAWDESSVADLETWNAGRDRDAVVHGVCQEQAPALESLAPLGGRFDMSGVPDMDSTSPFFVDRRAASYVEYVGRRSGELVSLETYLSAYRFLRNEWLNSDAGASAWEYVTRQDQMVEEMLLARVQDDPVEALMALQQFALEKMPKGSEIAKIPDRPVTLSTCSRGAS